jgi:hypothetical protein
MNSHDISQLQQLFAGHKADPFNRLNLLIRRKRSQELRALLSEPQTITLDSFNKDVWVYESKSLLNGKPIDLNSLIFNKTASPEYLLQVETALANNQIELHGNYTWGTGAAIYGSRLTIGEEAKLQQIQTAVHILNQPQLSPLANQLIAISGFGPNIATGLVMMFHPREFAIYNAQVENAMATLGRPNKPIEAFEQSASELRELLGAEDFLELDWFLYLINQGKITWPVVPPITADTRYWKIAPGENAFLWDEWKQNNYVAIGWPDMGDATTMAREDFNQRQREVISHPEQYQDAHRYTPDSVKQLWQFARDIKIGDRVVTNNGTKQVLGIGVVAGPCEFHPEAGHYLHRLPVMWTDTEPKTVQQGGWRSTLIELSREKFDAIAGPWPIIDPPPIVDLKTYPLNQILYGPPGTGKTYNSIERAVEIIDSQKYSNHADAKTRFDELRSEGRIGFVTFHQSFGYEDFVEGIRPVMQDDYVGEARYEIRDGIFKRMALRAKAVCLNEATPQATPNLGPLEFDSLWQELVREIQSNPQKFYESKRTQYQLQATPEAIQTVEKGYKLSRADVESLWDAKCDEGELRRSRILGIIGEFKEPLAYILLQRLEAIKDALQQNSSALQLPNSSTATNPISPAVLRYVLIIDEINRGNISKILGELITLLEPDKRSGGDSALTVTLPHSGESFTVPLNLYILGTMNTADKSLALLDVALRRRFKFIEYSPDFTVGTCPQLPETARRVLLQLNHRIVLSKDRDHRIGHSFFVGVKAPEEFNEVFRFEIIPLLQEYFYNDWDGLRFVLGEDSENGKFIRALKAEKTRGVRNRWQWYFDERDDPDFDCLQTLTTNYFSKPPTEPSDANEG